jgi:hypothetical protein
MDCPAWSARKITLILLVAGIDKNIRSNDGRLAFELAEANTSKEAFLAFQDFESEDNDMRLSLEKMKEELDEKYTFKRLLRLNVEEFNANFEVPDFIYEKQRAGGIPQELTIFEHQIKPLMDGISMTAVVPGALNCLVFTKNEAVLNQRRRLQILQSGDATWQPDAASISHLEEKPLIVDLKKKKRNPLK